MHLDLHCSRFEWAGGDDKIGPAVAGLAQRAEAIGVRTMSFMDHFFQMDWMAHTGRGVTPGAFLSGTARGDAALDFVTEQTKSLLYPDLDQDRPPGYEGTMSGYRTFLAVPIWVRDIVYGMVTADAPEPNTLTDGDLKTAELAATLMGAAFEVCFGVPAMDGETAHE